MRGTAQAPPPLYFHELEIASMRDLHYWSGLRSEVRPNFPLAECAAVLKRPGSRGAKPKLLPCVPRYLLQWQALIRTALRTSPAWKRRYSSCSVVGSSASLLHTPRGAQIDGAEAVVRINQAPAGGQWASHAGRRTTIRVWGAGVKSWGKNGTESWGKSKHLSPSELGAAVLACPPVSFVGICWSSLGDAAPTAYPRLWPYTWRHLRQQIARQINRSATPRDVPTTGAIAVYLALRSCDRVALFGFGDCTPVARGRAKYFMPSVGRKKCARRRPPWRGVVRSEWRLRARAMERRDASEKSRPSRRSQVPAHHRREPQPARRTGVASESRAARSGFGP